MSFGAAPFGATPLGAVSGRAALLVTAIAPTTLFGTPFAVFLQIGTPAGVAATAFGLANVYPGYVPGFLATQFGTPAGPQRWQHINAGPTTQIPRAYYAFAQTLTATGRSTTVFGTPNGRAVEPSGGVSCQPSGFVTTSFGTPAAASRQDAPASGSVSTAFGTPTYLRGGARVATGFSRTRLGKPKGLLRTDVRYASGATTTALGTPTGRINNRVTAMPPITTFGTPLLTRSTTC